MYGMLHINKREHRISFERIDLKIQSEYGILHILKVHGISGRPYIPMFVNWAIMMPTRRRLIVLTYMRPPLWYLGIKQSGGKPP
jgi:hypothetical protein